MKSIIQSFYSSNYGYPFYHRVTEIISIFIFFVYISLISNELFGQLYFNLSGSIAIYVLLMLSLGYIAADFFSGLVHFLCDNFGTPETPWLGPSFIKSFRDHHTDPKGITRHDFIEVNGSNCLASMLVLVPVYYFVPFNTSFSAFLFAFFMLSLILSVFFTNQFHKWAHQENPPKFIQILQNRNIILGRKHHSVHHTDPYNKYYCITCGWLNPILTKIRFFESLEKGIRFAFRSKK